MPELLTKHPDIVIELLLETGRVKLDEEKTILTKCPDSQFLRVYDKRGEFIGELCVYDISKIDEMTQFGCDDVAKSSKKCSLCKKSGHNKSNQNFHPKL